jgi:hypothetical protein
VQVGRRAIAHVIIVIGVSSKRRNENTQNNMDGPLQHALPSLTEKENLSKRCSCTLPCNIALGGVRATFKKGKSVI